MSYYEKHIFFCTNQRSEGKVCCQQAGANELREYAKQQIKALGLTDKTSVRINSAGCLGRCNEGPVIVIYPQGIWYTYRTKEDIDEIIAQQLIQGNPVQRLLLQQEFQNN